MPHAQERDRRRSSAEESDEMIEEMAGLAPPRSAVMGMATSGNPMSYGRGAAKLGGEIAGGVSAGLSALGSAMNPLEAGQDQKLKSRADTRAIADAARAGSVHGTGELNTPVVRPAAPSSDATRPKAGTGRGAAMTTDPHYANTVPVRMPDGRVIWADPATARTLGGTGIDRGEAMARSGNREDMTSQFQGAHVAKGSEGAAYFRPSRRVQLPKKMADRRDYSEQVRSLVGTMPEINLADPGTNWSFSGGREEGGGAPREGTRQLSGIEQAMARRTWLEGRARQEREMEIADTRAEQELAAARVDPLERARIEAQGRYGGDVARVALDLRAREAAVEQYDSITAKIESAREALATAQQGSVEEARLREYIDLLERERRERANLIIGQRISDPRTDQFGAFFSGLTTPVGGAGTPASGAR